MKTIADPFICGFEFVAGQSGASEVQIAHFTRRPPGTIMKSNQHIGSILAWPYHGTRGPSKTTLDTVEALWSHWRAQNSDILKLPAMTLTSFRDLIDPWLRHIQTELPEQGRA